MLFPSKKQMPTRRPVFAWDGVLVSTFALAWTGALAWVAQVTDQAVSLQLLGAFVMPLVQTV